MPLVEMSPNLQETEGGRKRSHDEFSGDVLKIKEEGMHKEPESGSLHPPEPGKFTIDSSRAAPRLTGVYLVLPPMHHRLHLSPQGSPELTEGASSTPARPSPDPSTPSKKPTTDMAGKPTSAAAAEAPVKAETAKRRKLTPAEKEARDKEAAEKKKRKEEEDAERKKRKEEEEVAKAARMKEREEQRKLKAEKDKIKAQEREEQRQQKEDKKKKIQEEKEKEARKQPKLKSFFAAPATPKKNKVEEQASNSPRHDSPVATPAALQTTYRRMFQPFFVKEHTILAPSATRMDQETREAKSAILDEFINGTRTLDSKANPFRMAEVLALPKLPKRGKLSPPVKHVMDDIYKSTSGSGSSADEASRKAQAARAKLARVPVKIIAFAEDVRPPYYGTLTWKPVAVGKGKMRQLAQQPMSRTLLPLDYDYDSEAEWQEDEEGEDLDLEDDEEDMDDEDDMDGFLDDSEDIGPARVMAINAMEPNCSGLQFEDASRRGCTQETYGFKLEMILGMYSPRYGHVQVRTVLIYGDLQALKRAHRQSTHGRLITGHLSPRSKR